MPTLSTGRSRVPEAASGRLLQFNLAAEIEGLRHEPAWVAGRNAKTLVKYADFRVVLTVLRAGTVVRSHRTAGRISVQTVSGAIRMHVEEHSVNLPAGSMLVLDRAVDHDVEAVEDSAFLLTIAWPKP